MADPGDELRSTAGKANFQRLSRLLISGGTCLLREIFDGICAPFNLPTMLSNTATKNLLKRAKLTKPQWDCLYPSPGTYGRSTDFDVTLLFRLLRTICNLAPPAMGWDVLPAPVDHSLTAELARIKYYRNTVYGHVKQDMEVTDDEFPSLWQEISGALVRIAGQISHAKKTEWQGAIDKFLTDPLTEEDERNVEELTRWCNDDVEVKKSIEVLKTTTEEGINRLEVGLAERIDEIRGDVQCLQTVVQEEAQGIKNQLEKELKNATQEVQEGIDNLEKELGEKTDVISANVIQSLQTTVHEEAKDLKDQLGDMHRSILDRLSSSAAGSQSAGGGLITFLILKLTLPNLMTFS